MHFWLISNHFVHNIIVSLLLPKKRTRLKTNLAFWVSCSERERERETEIVVCVCIRGADDD